MSITLLYLSLALGADPFVEEAERWIEDPSQIEVGGDQALASPATRARILLADDNADMRDYVSSLLTPTASRSTGVGSS